MQIAFDHQIFALQAYGGISRYFVRLAEHLAGMSETVRVFAPLHCNNYLGDAPQGMVDGYKVPDKLARYTRFAIPYNKFVGGKRIASWAPDVVHETYFSLSGAPHRPSRTILTVYDMVHEKYPEEFSRLGNISMRKRAAVKRADHVICISESTRDDLIKEYEVDESKVSVVYLGVDSFAAEDLVANRLEDASRDYLLFVGSRAGYKNFQRFLKAFSHSAALKEEYDIVCFGGGAFTLAEKDLMRALGLSEGRVRQYGGGDNVLGDLYSRAAAFVYPSMYEGFGLPPLEAMAKGCPVIVSQSSSMPEVVGDAGYYFDPMSIEEMSGAMEKVVFTSSLRRSLVSSGYKRIQQFSWASCAKSTMDVYNQVVK